MRRHDSHLGNRIARMLLGLASSLVIVGSLSPLDPLGPRPRRRAG